MLGAGEHWQVLPLLIGWSWMAFGLYAIGCWLDNRGWSLCLELLRLALNVPAMAAMALWGGIELPQWALVVYSLLSLIGLLGLRRAERLPQVA